MKWQLVEQATHVDTTSTMLDEERIDAKKRPRKEEDDEDTGADKNVAAAGETENGADEAPAPMSSNLPSADVATESVMVAGLSSVRRHRLSFALGTGVSVVNGNADVTGQLVARYEHVLGNGLVGAEGSLWLVGGVHGEGSLLAIGSRGITRRLELGIGAGVHLTGDAAGPALDLALRIPLTRSLRLFLRYDGALLLHDGTTDGQNAVSAGIETTW
jgi:hypothetical protein